MDTLNDTLAYWAPHIPRKAFDSFWPPILTANQAQIMTGLMTISRTQWLAADIIEQRQLVQAVGTAHFASEQTNYYAKSFKGIDFRRIKTLNDWRSLPILTRLDIQANDEEMLAKAWPQGEKPLEWLYTSGSTGVPLRVKTSVQAQYFISLLLLREHEWQKRNLKQKSGTVRYIAKEDRVSIDHWSPNLKEFVTTGPAVGLSIKISPEEQLRWLAEEKPEYFLTYPSNLQELASLAAKQNITFPYLRELRTMGEIVTPKLRHDCAQVFKVPLVDNYSSQEVGYIALQCPTHPPSLHVQSENILLEVVREDGSPCEIGEIGQVVITALHNHAMPIIRYATGDLAELGPPCPCGRGLPVLHKIVGRVRNMFTLANGSKIWPTIADGVFKEIGVINQFQVIQKTLTSFTVKLVASQTLTTAQEELFKDAVFHKIDSNLDIVIEYHDKLERSSGGKFHEFMSLL